MTKKTVALYARAYGPRADTSLMVQIDGCRRLAETMGCADPEPFVDRDVPNGEYGIALDRLLTVSSDARFDSIVTASRDRLSSDPAELYRILKQLTDLGIAVHFLHERSHFVADPI